MNNNRRTVLKTIVNKLSEIDAMIAELGEMLQDVIDEETEALENMPESLQESERGEKMQEYIDAMESVLDDLNNMDIEDMADQLGEICGN